ncbi:Hpt domain-containing protein [Maridesulfovibrio sp.]|uniref:Hpt domain-containing protein n=1 Tax=Maridesulfovibrio sp. TaxID=2795000 RepID=UPI002A18A129|nr:Hpt domain-containing protein [Maridesulfovibrio sp.]
MAGLEDKIAEIARRYAAALEGRVVEIEGCLGVYEVSGTEADLEAFYTKAHAIAGSARTFGLPEVTAKAKDLELAARGGAEIKILHEKLTALKKCISS